MQKSQFAPVLGHKLPKIRQKQAKKQGLCLLFGNPTEIVIG